MSQDESLLGESSGGGGGAIGIAAITGGSITGVGGVPYLLASSFVAVSGAGDTVENTLATITVPANALGANGILRIQTIWTYTNSANNKILRVRYSGASGTVFKTQTATTTVAAYNETIIANRGLTNSQVGPFSSIQAALGTATGASITAAIDTTAATTIVITGEKASGGETLTLDGYMVELIKPAS